MYLEPGKWNKYQNFFQEAVMWSALLKITEKTKMSAWASFLNPETKINVMVTSSVILKIQHDIYTRYHT